jgi:hypothetical protein
MVSGLLIDDAGSRSEVGEEAIPIDYLSTVREERSSTR